MVRSWHLNVAAGVLALVGLTAVFVGSAGDSWAAPSVVLNGDFDSDVGDWTAGTDTTIFHDPSLDRDLNPPGAALVTYTGSGTGDATVFQCIDLTGDGFDTTPLELAASYREPAGQANNPQVSVDITLFDDTNCSTNPESHPSSPLPDANNTGWLDYDGGLVLTTTKLSIRVDLVVHGTANGDAGVFDRIAISAGDLDTPTASTTPTATASSTATTTPAATNTPMPTNTGVPTDTVQPTDTPEIETATSTPLPTDTPVVPTNTSVPPANTAPANPPAASVEESTGDAGTAGEQPEGAANAGGEEPEGAGEVPEAGHGPGSYGQGGSHTADVIAAAAFALAIGMLSAGFWMRKKAEQEL